MAMEKEALTHKIEDDLAARNRNWDKLTSHLAESAIEAHLPKNVGLGNVVNMKQVRIYTNGQSNTGFSYDFMSDVTTNGAVFLVVAKGVGASPQYCELVGLWLGSIYHTSLIPVNRATITYSGTTITVEHEGYVRYSVIRLD